MTGRPTVERRYEDDDRQRAYETGWRQQWDHDSFRTLDWIEHAVDHEHDEARRCELRAAMLEGCADALLELADRQMEGAVLWRTPDGEVDAA